MRFLSNLGCKIIFMCSNNFWHQQDSNSLFKGSIGHVMPFGASGLLYEKSKSNKIYLPKRKKDPKKPSSGQNLYSKTKY